MDIKNKPTLEEKQTFWAEQLPNFEAKYWLPSHFEFVVFDMNQGNYVVKDGLDSDLEDDATEVYHRVNTGWAMWKKAINFTKAQAVPYESCSTKSHEIIINETKNELIDGYDIAKEDEYLLESLVYRGVCIGEAQAVPEGFVLVEKKEFEQMQEFEDLYRRAIFNSKKSIHEVNWSHVSNLGVGSTRAKAMCKRFNIDPEATSRKPQEPTND